MNSVRAPSGDSPELALLESDPAGGTSARWPGGPARTCLLEPALADVLASLAEGSATVPVTIRLEGEMSRPALALALPGDPDRALLVTREAGASLAAPLVENLVNQIAHDVRNHAFTVGLQAEMGVRRSADSAEGRAHFEAVLRQVDQLRHYLDWLLLFGRKPRLSPAPFDLAELIRQEIQTLQFSQEPSAPPASVSLELAPEISQVVWDRRAMGTVLGAVLDNALRSASPAPPVVVRALISGGRIQLEIRDRGHGIPPEKLGHLAVPMAVRRAGGAGLGLAIARKLVRAHGGTLTIAADQEGTTVSIRIPIEASGE